MVCPFCGLETRVRHVNHTDCMDALKQTHDDVYARLARIKALLEELRRTPRNSPRHQRLIEEIHTEASAYLAVVDGTRGADGNTDQSA